MEVYLEASFSKEQVSTAVKILHLEAVLELERHLEEFPEVFFSKEQVFTAANFIHFEALWSLKWRFGDVSLYFFFSRGSEIICTAVKTTFGAKTAPCRHA